MVRETRGGAILLGSTRTDRAEEMVSFVAVDSVDVLRIGRIPALSELLPMTRRLADAARFDSETAAGKRESEDRSGVVRLEISDAVLPESASSITMLRGRAARGFSASSRANRSEAEEVVVLRLRGICESFETSRRRVANVRSPSASPGSRCGTKSCAKTSVPAKIVDVGA